MSGSGARIGTENIYLLLQQALPDCKKVRTGCIAAADGSVPPGTPERRFATGTSLAFASAPMGFGSRGLQVSEPSK